MNEYSYEYKSCFYNKTQTPMMPTTEEEPRVGLKRKMDARGRTDMPANALRREHTPHTFRVNQVQIMF